MKLGTYPERQDSGVEREVIIIYMLGDDYKKAASFEKLEGLKSDILAKAQAVLDTQFLDLISIPHEREMRLEVKFGTTLGCRRQDLIALRGWIELFDYNLPRNV